MHNVLDYGIDVTHRCGSRHSHTNTTRMHMDYRLRLCIMIASLTPC